MRATSTRWDADKSVGPYFGATIRCDGSSHTVVQCLIPFLRRMTCSRCALKKQTFKILVLNVALNPANESPYGRVVTLEQCP